MSQRIEQINELLHSELAQLASREVYLENGLITILYIKTSPDLRNATVGISVLPENLSGSALRLLRKNARHFSDKLKKKLNLKFIPKFKFEIDKQERHAVEIDNIISEIQKNDK